MIEMESMTLQKMLSTHIQDPGLKAALSPENLGKLIIGLEELPKELYAWGKDIDGINESITSINKQLNMAQHNLAVAEATAISFPERALKNAEERKAYVTEKTEGEQAFIIELQNTKLDLETIRLEKEREFSLVNDRLSGAKYRARLIASLLQYLGR